MTPKLSDEQRQAVQQQGGRPVEVVDPSSNACYYLISSEQFDQIKALLEPEPFDIRETYAAQERALRSVWDDPELDIYNEPDTPPAAP